MRSPISDPFARFQNAERLKRDAMIKNHTTFFIPWDTIHESNPQEILERHEAVTLVPLLIMQGALDDNVLPAVQEKFAATYKAAGGDCQFQVFEGCEHEWVADAGPQTDRAREMVKAFIARPTTVAARSSGQSRVHVFNPALPGRRAPVWRRPPRGPARRARCPTCRPSLVLAGRRSRRTPDSSRRSRRSVPQRLVDERPRGAEVARAPDAERADDRPQFEPPIGERVLGARRMFGVEPPRHDAVLLEHLQPVREHRGRDPAQRGAEVLELARPHQQVAHDQQRPALAEKLQRAGHRAGLPVLLRHGRQYTA